MSERRPPEDIAGHAIWGVREEAAACSHRPEHIKVLFCDANASHRFARAMLAALTEEGYRIVHPDDVPELDTRPIATRCCVGHEKGWNACRAHIFGSDA